MIFVDASAIVAMVTNEPEAVQLPGALETSQTNLTSALAIYEATLGVARKLRSLEGGRSDVLAFLDEAQIRTISIGSAEQEAALDAFARFGKGRGHKALLNMGDCFAYACAKTHNAALLYKGDDFALTDIKAAV